MRLSAAVLLLPLLCACGQVGDLYLPEAKTESTADTAPTPAATPEPVPAAPKTKKK